MIRIQGHCPMGCGQTLHAEEGRAFGQIICMGSGCPGPMALQEILNEPETEHIVRFTGSGFTVRHPLRERLGDALMECGLHLLLVALPGPPDGAPGRFTAREANGQLVLERMAAEGEAVETSGE